MKRLLGLLLLVFLAAPAWAQMCVVERPSTPSLFGSRAAAPGLSAPLAAPATTSCGGGGGGTCTTLGSWTTPSIPTNGPPFELYGLAHDGTKFIGAALDMLASGDFYTISSTDGITWSSTVRTTAARQGYMTYGNGLFVSLDWTSDGSVQTSTNGHTWTSHSVTSPPGAGFYKVIYGNGKFVATPGGTGCPACGPAFGVSSDGITWTMVYPSTYPHANLAYGNGIFVNVGIRESDYKTSPDATTWTDRTFPDIASDVTFGNGLFVAVGDATLMTSSNGTSWSLLTIPVGGTTKNWTAVAYGDGRFVALSDSSGMLTSTDGVNWTYNASGPGVDETTGELIFGGGKFMVINGTLTSNIKYATCN